MAISEDDAATALLRQLLEEHPNACDDEMWELFSQAFKYNDEVKAAIERFHIAQLN